MVSIPKGVNATVSGKKVSMKGPKGSVEREFKVKGLVLKLDGSEITVAKEEGSKLSFAVMISVAAHIANMAIGASEGYEKKMTIVYAHFPISVEVKGDKLLIKNFIGEKKPREARIIGATKIVSKGADVTVSGPSKEDVGQTVSNIRTCVKIRNRDPRVFQDGLYVTG